MKSPPPIKIYIKYILLIQQVARTRTTPLPGGRHKKTGLPASTGKPTQKISHVATTGAETPMLYLKDMHMRAHGQQES